MFVIGNLLSALASLLDVVLQGLTLIVLVNALLSWVRPDPDNPIVRFLDRLDLLCNPVRRLFRRRSRVWISPVHRMRCCGTACSSSHTA